MAIDSEDMRLLREAQAHAAKAYVRNMEATGRSISAKLFEQQPTPQLGDEVTARVEASLPLPESPESIEKQVWIDRRLFEPPEFLVGVATDWYHRVVAIWPDLKTARGYRSRALRSQSRTGAQYLNIYRVQWIYQIHSISPETTIYLI